MTGGALRSPPGAADARDRAVEVGVVAIGGAAGAAARWAVATAWPTPPGGAGWAILAVNLTGCLLIGLLAGGLSGGDRRSHLLRLGLVTGALGGFTTFSTLAVETDRALSAGEVLGALVVLAASVVGGLAVAAAGLRLGGRVATREPVR